MARSMAHDGRAAALALVAQVERQASDIVHSYDNGNGVANSYNMFRGFTEKLDQFHVFVGLVEGRLGDIEPEKQAAQARNLTDIRWRMQLLELAAMQAFLVAFAASGKPWPLGSKAFLSRRGCRLDEISCFHRDEVAQYDLPPPDPALLLAVAAQFQTQAGHSLALEDFGSKDGSAGLARFDEPVAAPASEPMPVPEPARQAAPPPVQPASPPPSRPAAAAAAPPAAPGGRTSNLKPKKRLAYRVEGENVYFDGEAAGIVNDACKVAGISLDELAKRMGLGRATLVLLLNGSDAIERKPLTQLRDFVMRNGGLI